jgi:hypothetical protein
MFFDEVPDQLLALRSYLLNLIPFRLPETQTTEPSASMIVSE